METRSRIGKMCVCAVVLLAMVGMTLPPVIAEGGKASPAVAELNTCSALESVYYYALMAITGDIPPVEERMTTQNAKGKDKGEDKDKDTDGDGLRDEEEKNGTVIAACVATAPDFSICQGTTLDDQLFIANGASCSASCTMTLDYSDVDNSILGTYNYTVTCVNGSCSDTDTGTVTVIAACVATAPDFSICQGTTLDDQLFIANGASCSASCTMTLDYSGVVNSILGTYNYTVTCVNEPCSDTDTGTVTVIAACVATAPDFSICQGTTLDDQLFIANGASCSASCTMTLDYSGVVNSILGTYNYTVTCVNEPCSDTDTGTVTVIAACVATAPDFSICQGTTLDDQLFIANGASCSASCTMTLDYSDVDNSILGTYNYTVTCVNEPCSDTDTGTVTVIAACVATASDFSICQGTTLDDQLFIVNGASCSAGCTMTLDYSGVVNSILGTYNYTVTCVNGPCSDTDTGTVTVIAEGGEASPAVAELNTSSAPESVDDYAQMAITGDIPPIEVRMKTQKAKGGGKDKGKDSVKDKDTDGDGLTDLEEKKGTFGYKTDHKNPDTDGDGLNDLQEYWWLCDPTDPDTNGDSFNDGESVYDRLTYPYVSDSLTEHNDPDGDGLPTGAERYDTGTDYKTFSTDGDPYGDGQEYFGINMPSISPADHPLVAAYPDLSARLEAITVTPKATITSTTGGAKQDAWSITTETSDSETFEWGLEESVEAGFSGGIIPSVEVTVTAHQTWADTHTVTNSETESGWTQEEWSTATTIDTVEAAYLKFTMNVKNRGTAPAEKITPHVTILMGEEKIATITSPTSIDSLGMGDTSPPFVVDQGIVGMIGEDITATLDELRAIDCGAPLDIETLQVTAKIKKWDVETDGWVLTDYSTYMNEINKGSATLMLVLSDGTFKKYKVFAGSDNYNPGVTLGEAINWTIGRDDSVPQQEENQMWYFGFSGAAFDEAIDWIDTNNNIQDLTLKPNWEIVVRAQSTQPEPQIEWAFYRADMKGVYALVTDDMGIKSVIAHVNTISGGYTSLTMTDDNGDAIYIATTTEEMVEDEDAYVIATDIEGAPTQLGIEKPPTPVKPPLASGDYVITAKHSGKSLTVEGGSSDDRANVFQYSYWGDAHQKWHLKHVGDGNYEITAMHSGKCLEVADSLESDGVNVRQNGCNDAVNQIWQLADAEDGYYKIVNKNSDKCLDVSGADDRANVRQRGYGGADNQKWVLQPVNSYPSTVASYYAITAKHSGKSLAVNDSNVEQQEYESENWQRMVLRPVGDGYFSIIARHSGQCLSIEDGSADEGANVVPETYVGSDDQRWKVESIGGGYYKICAKHSYKCLAVNGDNVEQQEYEGKDYQRWKFEAKDLVILYEHPSYGGKSKMFQGEVPYVGYDFNDIASSLEVPEGYAVIVYEYQNYGGKSKLFMSDASYVGDDFNDITSSLKVIKEIGDIGWLKITNKNSGKCLSVEGKSTDNGANVHQWAWADQDNNKWQLEPVGGGYYKICAKHSGKCLDVAIFGILPGGLHNGANVQQWAYGDNDNQKWKLEQVEDGYYRIINKNSGKCLSVKDQSTDNGANVHQWEWKDHDNNKWKLEGA